MQSILVVCVQISTLLLTPVVRPAISPFATPSEETPFSYWSINLGFIIEGNLLLCSSYLPLGVHERAPHNSSTSTWSHQAFFWRRCRGERSLLQGESLALNLFILFLFCLFYFTLFLFALFYQKSKKIVSLFAFIFVVLFFC